MPFFCIHISQGSVATCLKRSRIFKHELVANLLPSRLLKNFWKLVNICWSYGKEFGVLFFLTHNVHHNIITANFNTHTHTRLTALFLGLPRWASTRKVKPIWILLKQETVSGSGISWAICKSAPRSRHITMPAPSLSFYRPDALPAAQPTTSKHWGLITDNFKYWQISLTISILLTTQNEPSKYRNKLESPQSRLHTQTLARTHTSDWRDWLLTWTTKVAGNK